MEWPDEVSEVNMKPPKRLRIVPSAAETALEGQEKRQGAVDVSIIMPVYNASCWLDECLQAILDQDFTGTMELSVFDDASTDDSRKVVETWRERLEGRDISLVFSGHNSDQPRGVGYAKNKAVAQSCGKYLCFQDADDIMLPQRVRLQYEASVLHSSSLIGCKVRRLPEGSTQRYTRWINTITQDQLLTYIHPMDRQSSCRLGSAQETGSQLLDGSARRARETIWNLRVGFLQERVISQWESFTIWNAGKQGRKLYRCLNATNQKKVKAFCDVDKNKIKKGFYTYEDSKERPKPKIPVLHYKDASPPFIICVKLDMTAGVLEENLNSLQMKEGIDFFHFN
ncbi:UDP-GlcNAc:betaGal beta-1,3-N-acetylglucosaminyltransferase-like protein 1 isoform X5 [Hippocampus zosterae]|uniref:UDP-GlcNAc:betaGal beta-1,3-N-acetylglucosaminyltransferase-like protein 1 isoform X5 n=1 Tax=Hippocampus zosterae TaxID=109293 RepID=UPI00223CDE55|nr:UDP-GlcNAc:betaGal beta-1,3-N-acetylglucosaminyltransferase-like protein 1 isoform X5 [Hippocampus zosterae]